MYAVTGLKQLPDSDRGSARPGGINNFGQVVGWASFTFPRGTLNQAFLWSEGVIRALGFLRHRDHSEAHAINDRGLVVGWSGGSPFDLHAFLWNELTGMEELGTLPDRQLSEAHAINNSGEVVGGSFNLVAVPFFGQEERGKHAFIWRESTGMEDLNVLLPPNSGWELIGAQDINDSGQILCEGFHTGPDNARERRLCVLTPS